MAGGEQLTTTGRPYAEHAGLMGASFLDGAGVVAVEVPESPDRIAVDPNREATWREMMHRVFEEGRLALDLEALDQDPYSGRSIASIGREDHDPLGRP